jgi:hypothetical protein
MLVPLLLYTLRRSMLRVVARYTDRHTGQRPEFAQYADRATGQLPSIGILGNRHTGQNMMTEPAVRRLLGASLQDDPEGIPPSLHYRESVAE